jgi:hypothetical protein
MIAFMIPNGFVRRCRGPINGREIMSAIRRQTVYRPKRLPGVNPRQGYPLIITTLRDR